MYFMLVQILFWMALSTWFGTALFLAVAPQIIQRTVRENNPILPTVLSVNLEGQHSTLLSGSIIASLMAPLQKLELVCSIALLVALVGQWIVLAPTGEALVLPILRSAMYIAATVIFVYDWRMIWPKIWQYRKEYLDHVDEPEIANPALDQFDRHQSESMSMLQIILALLIAMILFSAGVTQPISIPLH